MSDWKSKVPSLNEVSSMTMKFLKDIKKSVGEIIDDYQCKHKESPKTHVHSEECTTKGDACEISAKTTTKKPTDKTKHETTSKIVK